MTPEITPRRFREIRKKRAEVDATTPKDALTPLLQKGQTQENAFKQYPFGTELEYHIRQATIRKKVSEAMFKEDGNLSPEEQKKIIDRQINRYYWYEIHDPTIHGHIEAPHGIKPSQKMIDWYSSEKKTVSYEADTAEIAQGGINHMVFNRPRIFTDVNHLPNKIGSSFRSEGVIYTKEDNLNAIKAQRDLTKRILAAGNNLDENEKAINPHLAIYFHGKVDIEKRGHDFEIAARQKDGKGPIDPRLAFWIADKIEEKITVRGLKNSKGEKPTINVVTYHGAYAGSPALTRMRYGDDLFGFSGFGEMLQCLQLECSRHLLSTYPQELTNILNEILVEFTTEFKTPQNLDKLDSNQKRYESKLTQEKVNVFNISKIGYDESISESKIALSASIRDELMVENGDRVMVNGIELRVTMMKKEHLQKGNTMMLNSKYAGFKSIIIEKA